MLSPEVSIGDTDGVWRLWITRRIDIDGEPFDVWNYEADVGSVYVMKISGHAAPGAAPNEEGETWSWEIEWVTKDGRSGEMLHGDAKSRSEAKFNCVHAMLGCMRSLFAGTGKLLQGDLPVDVDSRFARSSSGIDVGVDVFGEFDWTPQIEYDDENHDLWCHSITHEEFYLTIEAPIAKGTREPPPELSDWKWHLLDEADQLVQGTAPSRARARELCVAALLDHLTMICTVTEYLYGADLPTSECTNRERPDYYTHEPERNGG